MSSFSEGDDDPAPAEWAVMAVSVGVTVLLFGYVAWHAATAPAAERPEASVVGTETTDDGRVVVTVELHNPGDAGLESVAVAADCADEPIEFTHVPTADRRTGKVVCPEGTEDPAATVVNWVEA